MRYVFGKGRLYGNGRKAGSCPTEVGLYGAGYEFYEAGDGFHEAGNELYGTEAEQPHGCDGGAAYKSTGDIGE